MFNLKKGLGPKRHSSVKNKEGSNSGWHGCDLTSFLGRPLIQCPGFVSSAVILMCLLLLTAHCGDRSSPVNFIFRLPFKGPEFCTKIQVWRKIQVRLWPNDPQNVD